MKKLENLTLILVVLRTQMSMLSRLSKASNLFVTLLLVAV